MRLQCGDCGHAGDESEFLPMSQSEALQAVMAGKISQEEFFELMQGATTPSCPSCGSFMVEGIDY